VRLPSRWLLPCVPSINRARDVRGRNVLVNGAGPIGSLVVAAAEYAGAATVMQRMSRTPR